MMLKDRVTEVLRDAVNNREAAGLSVLLRKNGQDVFYAQAGLADLGNGVPLRRDTIFRLYSQSKPVTAAAVMLLLERGMIDLLDPVEKFLPGFKGQKVWTENGPVPAQRPVDLRDLLGMTAGLCYPAEDGPGQCAARVFDENQRLMDRGEKGYGTVEFCDRLGREPLAFQPGAHFRYSSCADVLGAVVEVVTGMKLSAFLKKEFFEPLGMRDTAFFVPEEKRSRFAACYVRTPDGLKEWTGRNLCCGDYSREPAFESGGAGLVSTMDDYAAFADMLLQEGRYNDVRILSPESVRCMTRSQLMPMQLNDMWDSLWGFGYGRLQRVMLDPGQYAGFARPDEYGWDGWLGTYFANFPNEKITLLLMQNTTDTGTGCVTRKVRNVILAAESRGEF